MREKRENVDKHSAVRAISRVDVHLSTDAVDIGSQIRRISDGARGDGGSGKRITEDGTCIYIKKTRTSTNPYLRTPTVPHATTRSCTEWRACF